MRKSSWALASKKKRRTPTMKMEIWQECNYASYQEFVRDTFIEDQIAYGLDVEEAADLFSETPFHKIEKFLIKSGYDLGGNNYE
jgi:hypothetical protein